MDHGYTSIIELCSALPEVIRMERPHSKGDWRLFDKRLPSPAKPGTDKTEWMLCGLCCIEHLRFIPIVQLFSYCIQVKVCVRN